MITNKDENVLCLGVGGGNGSSCEIHRQEAPPKHWIGGILRRVYAGEEAKQSRRRPNRHRFRLQQPHSPSGFCHHSSLPRLGPHI